MSEGPKIEKKDSFEQRFVFGSEDGEMRAMQFASDPVAYLARLNDALREKNTDTTDIVLNVIDEILACHHIIYSNKIPVTDQVLETYLTSGQYSEEGVKSLFTLLREAGFTKTEVLNWILIEDDEMTARERLDNRGMKVVLNSVYGED